MVKSEEKKGTSVFITKNTRCKIRKHRKSTERFKYRDGWRVESYDDVINRALDALDTIERKEKGIGQTQILLLDEKSSLESSQDVGVE